MFVSLSLADPNGSNALISAVQWVQNTLLGTIAPTIAVIAVASVGWMMLSGRIHYRRGVTVIAGCFVVFGAPSIVAGLQASLSGTGGEAVIEVSTPPPPIFLPPQRRPGAPAGANDPYAGASVPSE